MYFIRTVLSLVMTTGSGMTGRGTLKLLEQYAPVYHYELIEIPEQMIDDAAVSSTKIRHAINEGRMPDVSHMLDRHYTLKGTVMHGNKLGRTLGYPTANLQPTEPDQIIPAMGIYAIQANYSGITYNGMLSIGYNPTVTDKKELRIEANLFSFDQEIYGGILEIAFIKKLRDEQKFESLETLKEQLHKDKEETLRALTALHLHFQEHRAMIGMFHLRHISACFRLPFSGSVTFR